MQVLALHVHHGLSEQADAWRQHGKRTCARWAAQGLPVRFVAHVIEERPTRGESVEAWARKARHRALREMALAGGASLVLLAQHRRDQAETFLLQALRGGGVAALSAMPRQAQRDGVTWARPWLDRPREEIEAYARRHRLRHVTDDSNADLRFARNRLRERVWPTLQRAFPDAEISLASAARWAQEARAALDEWRELDLPAIASSGHLDIAGWRRLSPARQSQALRGWLREQLGESAQASLVSRLLAEAAVAGSRQWPAAGGELRSYRGQLRYVAATPEPVVVEPATVDFSRAGVHALPAWRGAFVVEHAAANGLAMALARDLQVRARRPGDRFQAGVGRPARSLKLQFQAAGIEATQRNGPIVCHGDRIVFVPGLGLDARAQAVEGDAQVSLRWCPD